ncbi:MAG: TonB family protein [Deltaproteobacteria bacterium]|nr:MAG: TonB family protein [Deltaproteobacteria bacterium]
MNLILAIAMQVALAAEPTLPVLEQTAPAVYPPEALATGTASAVLIELVVDEQGYVAEARVAESGGEAFDRAALDAVRAFVFAPATDASGRPASATILYRYVFEPQAVPVRSAEGVLRQAGSRDAMSGVSLRFTGPDGSQRVATSDADGRFALVDLAEGEWTAVLELPGYEVELVPFTVEQGKVAELKLFANPARPWEIEADEVVEVVGKRTAPEITERVLSAEEIYYLPGTNGDVVRVVQNLPGVARPPLNIGQLLIRGTAPEDSGYALDGVSIPIVFHFSGLSTVVAGDLLDEVSFLPGNYGVRYGRTLGGVVDLRASSELPDKSHGYVSVDVYQSAAYVEQRISERTALSFAGRRSYIDAVLNPILNSGAAAVQAPRYYDGQIRLQHETERGQLDAMLFASDDRFKVVGGMESDPDEVQIALITSFVKARVRWTEELGDGWRSEAAFLAGPDANVFEIAPEGESYERNFDMAWRQEFYRLPTEDRLGWRFGMDWLARYERFLYDVPAFGYEPEKGETLWLSPSPYAEFSARKGLFTVTPGLRVDPLFTGIGYQAFSIDPRVSATAEVTPDTTFKASAGRYSQFPELRQILDPTTENRLRPESSLQFSLGAEQKLGSALSLETVAYVNKLTNLVVGREDRFEFFTGPPPVGPFDTDPYANDGVGTIVGVEAQLKLQTERAVGWIAATTSRSVRTKRPGDEVKLFAFDQPIVINALGSYELPKKWRIGSRVRYGSGNPYTPVVNRFQLLDEGAFLPVYGETDSARLPSFYQVDLRVDKDWVFDRWKLTTYLDFQNITGAQNVEVMGWTSDYSEEDPITGLPPIPAFGVRGEW